MSGNKTVADLPLVPDPVGADLYSPKGGLDYRVRIGTANGLPYLDADGLLPEALLPEIATPSWGAIEGTIDDQTDLVAYIAAATGDNAGIIPITTVTTSKTLALADRGTLLYVTGGFTVTVPSNASVAFPLGTTLSLINTKSTSIILTKSSGVLLKRAGIAGTVTSLDIETNGKIDLVKVDTNTWYVDGVGIS